MIGLLRSIPDYQLRAVTQCVSSAAGVVAESAEEANWRKVFRIMEILREGEYDCDLQQTSH
jgi:hypothetical protein